MDAQPELLLSVLLLAEGSFSLPLRVGPEEEEPEEEPAPEPEPDEEEEEDGDR